MESILDPLNGDEHLLGPLNGDVFEKILMCLDGPSDLVRASCVSRSWRKFVIENGLCKQMCLRMFKCLNGVADVIEPICGENQSLKVGSGESMGGENLKREHRAYSFFAQGCTSFTLRECVLNAISASRTDFYPLDSIDNTLQPGDRVDGITSYWSSEGQSNPAVPETLIYKLVADICVITEISIQPFQAYFEQGWPIYSAKSVRFRMGHLKIPRDEAIGEPSDNHADNNFVWTYTSPEFPMAQENCLQKFDLPEPVICNDGILMVELLGRVQRQENDGLFYMRVSHVQVMGRTLSPAFGAKILEPSGKFLLEVKSYNQPHEPEHGIHPLPGADLQDGARDLEQVVDMLREQGVAIEGFYWNEVDKIWGRLSICRLPCTSPINSSPRWQRGMVVQVPKAPKNCAKSSRSQVIKKKKN